MEREFRDEYTQYRDWYWWYEGRRSIIDLIVDRSAPPDPDSKILSIGGGEFDSDLLEPQGHYYCVNPSLATLEAARPITDRLVVGGLPDLPFRSDFFDLICLFDVLEHIRDDEAALRETRRILDDDGTLVLTLPAFSMLWSRHDEYLNHFRRYNYRQIRDKLRARSFRIVDWTYFNTLLSPPIVLLRFFRKLLDRFFRDVEPSFVVQKPGFLNRLLAEIFKLERLLLSRTRLPFGISLIVVARVAESSPEGEVSR